MRKYLMVAALVAVAACGEKKAPASDSAGMAPAAMPTTVSDSVTKADSLRADSMRKADSMKAGGGMKMDTTKP